MKRLMLAAVALVALVLLTTAVAAGPYEDARTAYIRSDYATALRILRPLANEGDAAAQHLLGVLYAMGWGVPQDYAEAVKWFRLAADQGDAGAQFNLGVMYRNSHGVPQNYIYAHMWFNLAAAQRSVLGGPSGPTQDAGRYRAALAKLMTPAQIAEAQKLAREWRPKRP